MGVGYRRPLARWLLSQPRGVQCLEITAEHFSERDEEFLNGLSSKFPISVHGLGLSLGTPGPLDSKRLDHFAWVARAAKAAWISEHVAFTRAGEMDLGHLNPVRATRQSLTLLADHAKQVSDRCGKPLLLENITSHVNLPGDIPEPIFLSDLCQRTGCGLLLDVTNLFINSQNHRFDPRPWLEQLEPRSIRQMHIVGYSLRNGRFFDDHAADVQDDLLNLAQTIAARSPVDAVFLERDEAFPDDGTLTSQVEKLHGLRVSA